MLSNPFARAVFFAAGLIFGPGIATAGDDVDALARDLIDRFYDALAPDNAMLAEFLGAGFQIIGSDGLLFDREISFARNMGLKGKTNDKIAD